MADDRDNGAGRELGSLLRELAEGSAELLGQEVRLARVELSAMGRAIGAGTGAVAAGAVLALVGTLALVTGVILLPGDQWLRDRYWLAALMAFVVTGALAAWLAARGLARLRPGALVPGETVASLKEMKEITHGRHGS